MKLCKLTTLLTVSLLILSGCGSKPKPKSEPIVDDTLPKVTLTKNGTIADINAIALEWAPFADKRVKGIYIYKAKLDANGGSEAGDDYYDTVNNPFTTHYLDTDVEPDTKYSYYFKSFSVEAESLTSDVALISSLPMMNSVTWIHSIQNMPRSAKILWRPHDNQKVKAYLIQRRTLESEDWEDIATVDGRLSAEYIDSKLKDEFTYIYRIRSLTYDKLVSKPSIEVSTITKSLPLDVKDITATTDLPKKIEIKWGVSDTKDFSTYRVYRSSDLDGSYKLLVETKENVHVDNIEEDGKQYFYRVSMVDKDGLESINDKHSVYGTTLIKPKQPALVSATLENGEIKISWSKNDARADTYIVQKRFRDGFFKELTEDFEGIKDLEFIDREIEIGKEYRYIVYTVDKHFIKSEPSIEVSIKTDEVLETKEQAN